MFPTRCAPGFRRSTPTFEPAFCIERWRRQEAWRRTSGKRGGGGHTKTGDMGNPPRAKKIEHTTTLHGLTRSDPYHWLRDDDWQRVMREPERLAADIRQHLDAENSYTEEALAPTAELRRVLFEEL